MNVDLFNFDLPEELIAQFPLKDRPSCKLLTINRKDQTIKDETFSDVAKYFKKGDVLVRNNTKVIPARVFGIKEKTGAKVELLLLKDLGDDIWECLVGNAKAVKIDTVVDIGEGLIKAQCVKILDEGIRHFHMSYDSNKVFLEVLSEVGQMPLPPYIKKQVDDNDDYQTIYAKIFGSSAAPTAGFHFDDNLFDELEKMGVTICDVTLHVGLGTFRPVKVDDTDNHIMHSEYYEISNKTAIILNKAKEENRRIIAIGTTSVRTLEANISKYGCFKETNEETNIFIFPGYTWKAVDCLITNFHLPKSTLLMLVSSFVGSREFTLEAYKHAVEEKYRFFSFGDAMFIYG